MRKLTEKEKTWTLADLDKIEKRIERQRDGG